MTQYLLFVVLGLGAGSVYGILGLGLVLKHRSTGVIDFSHGAVAMMAAYVFWSVRSSGVIPLPWIWLPNQVRIAPDGIDAGWAALIALGYAGLFGLVLYMIVYRPLLHAGALTKVCASVGVMLAVQAIAVLNFGTQAKATPPFLPGGSWRVGEIVVPLDRLMFAVVVVVLAAGLAAVYRYTRFGLATRATAENSTGAALTGLSAGRIAAVNWTIASVLAGLAGVLITPIATLDPSSFTLFVIPALAAALLARFTSFAVTAAAGLGLGIVQSLITKVLTDVPALPQQGLPQGVPVVVVLIAMSLLTVRATSRGAEGSTRHPSVGRPRRPLFTGVVAFAVGSIVLVALSGSFRVAFITSLVAICLCLSVVVLTGYVGQVSLAQMASAGMSAFVLSHLGTGLGVPFPLSLLLAALAAVPVGLLVGLPALRVRGVNLAIVTLAAATALDGLLFNSTWLSGGLAGSTVAPPSLFGIDLGIARGQEYPRIVFGLMVLFVVCAVGVGVARLRNGSAGRAMLAVRSNERAAAAAGIDVARVKLIAFSLSSFIAGLGGALLAFQQGTVSPAGFAAFTSLALLAVTYVAGVGRIAGAVIAGVLFSSSGLLVTALDSWLDVGLYQSLIAGLALTVTAVQNPDGVAGALARLGRSLRARVSRPVARGPAPSGDLVPRPAPRPEPVTVAPVVGKETTGRVG